MAWDLLKHRDNFTFISRGCGLYQMSLFQPEFGSKHYTNLFSGADPEGSFSESKAAGA